ncbi:hypothetical protein L2E82_39134 [Cichorium intybus]|uniref:Uncharacterized protein n=1 Tax=Cichorium intybus TaxID=13427 RepID=A0ACB9AI56_CICIN|nr:hypothetical protein L2E82_39134 [Cichorium intybus]
MGCFPLATNLFLFCSLKQQIGSCFASFQKFPTVRSVDLVAPIIQEWTYDAMCHDVIYLNGNKYTMEIDGKIYKVIVEEGRKDLGEIEQDLVLSDARNKELLEFLEEYEDHNIESRLTLMMIYALADPEKFEGDNGKDI